MEALLKGKTGCLKCSHVHQVANLAALDKCRKLVREDLGWGIHKNPFPDLNFREKLLDWVVYEVHGHGILASPTYEPPEHGLAALSLERRPELSGRGFQRAFAALQDRSRRKKI